MTFLIRHLVFGSGPQAHRASSSINIRMQDEPISSAQGSRPRRRRRHHGQTPPSDQPQSTVQQILHPGNLLRRLLPSSSPFKSDSQASWAKKNCWVKKKRQILYLRRREAGKCHACRRRRCQENRQWSVDKETSQSEIITREESYVLNLLFRPDLFLCELHTKKFILRTMRFPPVHAIIMLSAIIRLRLTKT